MTIEQEVIETKLRAAFPDAEVTINDFAGDRNHYEVVIKSRRFCGLNLIEQHRLVYHSLGDCVGNDLHALKLQTIALD